MANGAKDEMGLPGSPIALPLNRAICPAFTALCHEIRRFSKALQQEQEKIQLRDLHHFENTSVEPRCKIGQNTNKFLNGLVVGNMVVLRRSIDSFERFGWHHGSVYATGRQYSSIPEYHEGR